MTDNTKIKKCPFCGTTVTLSKCDFDAYYRFKCLNNNCGCMMFFKGNEPIEAFNSRENKSVTDALSEAVKDLYPATSVKLCDGFTLFWFYIKCIRDHRENSDYKYMVFQNGKLIFKDYAENDSDTYDDFIVNHFEINEAEKTIYITLSNRKAQLQ